MLNDGSHTIVKILNKNSSAIDLTLCSPQIHHFMDWQIMPEPFGSNHIPIIIKYKHQPRLFDRKKFNKWNTKNVNWVRFQKTFDSHHPINENVNYDQFVNQLNLASEKTIPKKNSKAKSINKNKYWWNDACQKKVDERKMMFVKYKNNPTSNNLINYKKADARAKKSLNRQKRNPGSYMYNL